MFLYADVAARVVVDGAVEVDECGVAVCFCVVEDAL